MIHLFFSILSIILLYILKNIIREYRAESWNEIQQETITQETFLRKIDKYFISNKVYTIISIFIYITINYGTIVYLRYFFRKIDANYSHLFLDFDDQGPQMISFALLFGFWLSLLLNLIMLKQLMDLIFYEELLKMHIYFYRYSYYYIPYSYLVMSFLCHEVFGTLYRFFYNICKLRPPSNFRLDGEDLEGREYDEVLYKNQYIYKITLISIVIIKKYPKLNLPFSAAKIITRWCFYHVDSEGFIPYILPILWFFILFYDFIHFQIYLSYYAFLPLYFLSILLKYSHFLHKIERDYDYLMYGYFYENITDYGTYKHLLYSDISQFLEKIGNSETFDSLMSKFNARKQEFLLYLNNHLATDKYLNQENILTKNIEATYRKIALNCMLLIIYIYLYINKELYTIAIESLNVNIPLVYIILPLIIITLRLTILTYKPKTFTDETYYRSHSYNLSYNIMYWLIIMLQISIMLFIFIRGELLANDILIKISNIQLIKNYTIEEKIMVLYQFFEFCLAKTGYTENQQEELRYILRQIKLTDMITDAFTIKEIKAYVYFFLIIYPLSELYWNSYYANINATYIDEEEYNSFFKNQYYIFVRNAGAIAAAMQLFLNYKNLWQVAQALRTPEGIYKLAIKIIINIIKYSKK